VRSKEGEVRSEEGAFGFCAWCRERGGQVGYVGRCMLRQNGKDSVRFAIECFDDVLVRVLDTG